MKSSLALLASALILGGFTGQAWSQAEFQTVATFPQTPAFPKHGIIQASDGLFYGVTRFGGTGDAGALFTIDEASGSVDQIANFASIGVELGDEKLGLASDSTGALYGAAAYGGANRDGALWKWTSAGGLVRLASFDSATTGANPRGAVVTDGAGAFYGVCYTGGANGDGTLWKWTSAGGLVRLYSFKNFGDALSLGGRPQTVAIVNGVLYGTTAEKDNGTGPDIPVLWSRSAAGTMRQAAVFNTDTVGYPQGSLVVSGTGVAGIAYMKSSDESGTPKLWYYPGTGTTLRIARIFATTDRDLTVGSDGDEVYGTTAAGKVWNWAPSHAFGFVDSFTPSTLGEPSGSLVVTGAGDVFGTSLLGTDGAGSFWKWSEGHGVAEVAAFDPLVIGGDPNGVHVDSQGNVFGIETIRQFIWRWSAATGPLPQKIADVESPLIGFVTFGGVVGDADGNIFGFTKLGLAGNAGVLWRWNAMTGLAKVGTFGTTTVPGNATGHIAMDPDTGNVWGTTEQLVSKKLVVRLWRYTADTGLKLVYTFDSADGEGPVKAITFGPGGAIYGVCGAGGAAAKGTLWAWTDSSGFNNLADFGTPSAITTAPGSGLAVTQVGTVYGVTDTGGAGNVGRIWRWVPVVGLTAVKDFVADTTGAMSGTETGMIVASDGSLYGCAAAGGTNGVGTLWKCNPSGTPTLTAVKQFDPLVMAHPETQRLVQADDGMIYGVASHAIWRYGVAPTTPETPVAVTTTPSYVSASRVILEGLINPRGAETSIEFQLGTDSETFPETMSGVPDNITGTSPIQVHAEFGLDAKTTYYYRIMATNSAGTVYTPVAMVKTLGLTEPVVVTKAATSITTSALTLNALVTPMVSLPTTVAFDFGTSATALTREIPVTTGTISGSTAVAVSATVTGLLPHTKYFFRAKAAHDSGSNEGLVLSAITANTPPLAHDDGYAVLPSTVVDLPVLSNDTDADSDTLSVIACSVPPTSMGTVIKTATGLRFTATSGFSGTTITYTISDGFGGTSTASCVLTRGTPVLSERSHQVGSEGGTFPVGITTSLTWAAVSGQPWARLSPAQGSGDGAVTVTVLPNATATSRIATLVIGGVGHTLTQLGVSQPTVSQPSPLTDGLVGAPYSISVPTTGLPVTYLLTGTLPTGLRFIQATGTISGIPTVSGDFPITVKAKNAAGTSAPTSFTIHINPLRDSLLGSFFALLDRGTLNRDLGGSVTLLTNKNSTLSGTLKLGTLSYPLAGKILTSTNPTVEAATTMKVARTGLSSLIVRVTFDKPRVNAISVSISILGSSDAPLTGLGAHKPTSTPIAAGAFTSVINPPAITAAPQGNGYLTFKTTSDGTTTWTGKLADGTGITGAGFLSPDNDLPIWHLLYLNTGCLHGRVAFALPPINTLSGSPVWFKKPQASGRNYKNGFVATPCLVSGGFYSPPTGTIVLNLLNSAGNARLEFSGGGISSAEQAANTRQIFTIDSQNVPTLAAPGTATNLTSVTLKLDVSTGFFSGGFTLRDSNLVTPSTPYLRPVTFQGLLVPSLNRGAGFFLLNQLPSGGTTLLTSPIQSGLVVLDAAPPP